VWKSLKFGKLGKIWRLQNKCAINAQIEGFKKTRFTLSQNDSIQYKILAKTCCFKNIFGKSMHHKSGNQIIYFLVEEKKGNFCRQVAEKFYGNRKIRLSTSGTILMESCKVD
jgi:hypothetical protein